MPTDSLRMARIHPGHNGPPPLSNVIPEPAQNRVKEKTLQIFSCRRSRADLVVSFGVLHVLVLVVLEPLPLLSE